MSLIAVKKKSIQRKGETYGCTGSTVWSEASGVLQAPGQEIACLARKIAARIIMTLIIDPTSA